MSGFPRRIAGVLVVLAACGSPAQPDVSYCDAVLDLQQQWGYQRTLEGDVSTSFNELEEAVSAVERHNGIVAGAAPATVRAEWESVAGSGASERGAIDKAIDHADAECGSDLRGITDGLSPEEIEQYATPPAEA